LASFLRRRRRPVARAAGEGDDGSSSGEKEGGAGRGGGKPDDDAAPPPPGPARDSWDEEDQDDAALDRRAEAAADALLDPAWRALRSAAAAEAAAAGASADEAERIASMSLSEALDGDALLRTLAERELGPVLQSLGLPPSQALPFLFDLVRLAAGAQLAAAAAVFYGAEFFGGLDAGQAWRCVLGLCVGYAARLAIPVEALAWPLYDGLVRAATGGRGVYEPGAGWGAAAAAEEEEAEAAGARRRRRAAGGGEGASEAGSARGAEERGVREGDGGGPSSSSSPVSATARQRQQAAVAARRLALLAAAGALLPPLLLGWSAEESCWQFAAPALAGAFCFDAAYLAALVIKLGGVEGGGDQ